MVVSRAGDKRVISLDLSSFFILFKVFSYDVLGINCDECSWRTFVDQIKKARFESVEPASMYEKSNEC